MRFVFWRRVASVLFLRLRVRAERFTETERTRHAYARIYQWQRGEVQTRSSTVILDRVLTSNMRPVQRLYRSSSRRHHPRTFPLRECLHPARHPRRRDSFSVSSWFSSSTSLISQITPTIFLRSLIITDVKCACRVILNSSVILLDR